MSFQQCEFNFGWRPFKHPPSSPFNSFNVASKVAKCRVSNHLQLTIVALKLAPEAKQILPRPIKLAALKRLSVKVRTIAQGDQKNISQRYRLGYFSSSLILLTWGVLYKDFFTSAIGSKLDLNVAGECLHPLL